MRGVTGLADVICSVTEKLGTSVESVCICSVTEKLGTSVESVCKWVHRFEIDNGALPGVTSVERERGKDFERENR